MTDVPAKSSQIKQRNKRKRTGQLSGVQVMFAAILAIGLLLAINFSSRITASQPLQEAHRRVQLEISELKQEQGDLIKLRDFVQSDAYVQSWARSDGAMIRDGDVLVYPVPAFNPQAEPTPLPSLPPSVPVETTPPKPDSWQVWWALFFDGPPPTLD